MTDTILARPFHKVNAVLPAPPTDPHTAVKEVFFDLHDSFHKMIAGNMLNRFGLTTFIAEFGLFHEMFNRIGDARNAEWATRLMLEAQEIRNEMTERE